MIDNLKKWIFTNIIQLSSLAIAAYFFYVFHSVVGFPPTKDLNSTSTTYLVISIFFFLLPLAKSLKLGKLLEYEAKAMKLNEIEMKLKTPIDWNGLIQLRFWQCI